METNRTCRWVSRRLPLLAGGELAASDHQRVEDHLSACTRCRAELATATESLALLRQVGVATRLAIPAQTPSLWPGLARRVGSRRSVRPSATARRTWQQVGAGLAIAAALILAVSALARFGLGRSAPVGAPALANLPEAEPQRPLGTTSPAPPTPRTPARASAGAGDLARVGRRPSALPTSQPTPPPPGVDPFLSPTVDFDLDRGTLTSPGHLDTQRAY